MEKAAADNERKAQKRRLLFYILITVFFVCMVAVFYSQLYRQTRDNIINTGRINAIESASQIDKELLSSMNVVNLAAHTLDNMLTEGRSQKEILDFLTTETLAVDNTLTLETTGLYGYINGEYLDGSGWVPEEDYEPTERPWYLQAMVGDERIIIVDPYVDMDTGDITITLVKRLCDSESVVALDILMNRFQRVVEQHVRYGRSDSEFIINGKGIVIANSDHSRIGTDIYRGSDTLSVAISQMINSVDGGYTYLDYEGRDYMVYAMPLENDWACVSVIDATNDFAALRIPLIITILSAVIIIASFLFLMNRSEKKSMEAVESAQRTEEAMAASEAKSSFLSNMSHEIRTPINAVLGMNEMILRECEDEDILLYAKNVQAAGNTLLGLINDILDFSKIEAGKLEINPVEYDLSSTINDLVNMISVRAEEKGLALKTDFDPDTPKLLYGDEVRIKQVITNILTNAVKYTEKGGVTFRIGFDRVAGEDDGVILKVSVIDTGIGIKTEDMHKLFSEFERIEEKRNRNVEGTGLGMSITKNLLRLMDSELQVGSVYGQGSVFSFALKQKVVKWESLGDYQLSLRSRLNSREKYREKFTAPGTCILVVDDNPLNLTVFKSLIKKTRVRTETAESGEECLSFSSMKKYDIIFLDHMMPEKDGIETLKEMRAGENDLNKGTPVICLTANAVSGARQQYIKEGFNDYLTKPIDADSLEKMLMEYLPADKVILQSDQDDSANTAVEDEIPAAVRDCSVIDWKKGLVNSGSKEAYLGVLRIFCEVVDEKVAEIRKYYDEGNIGDFTIQIHALKSSLRIIGAAEYGEEAQRLEDAGKSGDVDYIRNHIDGFIRDYRELKDDLAPAFRGGKKASDRIRADRKLMDSVYMEILSAAKEGDSYLLESIFSEMEDYIVPDEDSGLFTELRDAARQYDYEALISCLEEKEAVSSV